MSADREQSLDVVIESVIFHSEDGRFAVARATDVSEPDTNAFAIVGELGAVAKGETLRLRGRWTEHAVYGARFKVNSFTPQIPTTSNGIARYLGSGLIPGIGPALAARLVDKFGDQTLEVITTESGRLREVSGIGSQRAQSIAKAVRTRHLEAETMSYLHAVGLGPSAAKRILKRYGDEATVVLRDDPYAVAQEITGIGFVTADQIGRSNGIADNDVRRVAGATHHLISKGADEGHVYINADQIHEGLSQLGVPTERIDEALALLNKQRRIVQQGELLYLPSLYDAELSVSESLTALAGRPQRSEPKGLKLHPDLSAKQRLAVERSLMTSLMVLTGGPGTGKTTAVAAIVEAHRLAGHRFALCAPTGRAAKRLTEATGHEAKTIHRLLEWNPATGHFNRNQHAPLDVELVLVDEASMLDIRLAQSLLSAVAPSSILVLVGDVDQLPPVGPGQPLRDLIRSEIATTIVLDEVFRQAQQSAIVVGAHDILQGKTPTSTPPGEKGTGDLFIVPCTDPEAAIQRLERLLRRMTPAYGLDPIRDVQVLSPMKRGPLGTESLNVALQEMFNPPVTSTDIAGVMRAGDKVMQLHNNYNKEVYNGDLGTVTHVEGGSTFVQIDGREVQYSIDDLDSLTLAYASTVHKVQGSEFDAVVIVLSNAHYMLLTRPLLYTAVTRAKKLAVLLGDPKAIARAAKNAVSYRTNSNLEQRLRQATPHPSKASNTAS